MDIERSQRPRAPPRNFVVAPLQGQLLRRLQDNRQNIFEPRAQTDYDHEAPLEPPRNLTDMARLAADRVATRLELMEMSPALRELKAKFSELGVQLEEVARRVAALELVNDERSAAESISSELGDQLEEVARRVAALELVNDERSAAESRRYQQELREEVSRVRSECLVCLIVTLLVGLFFSIAFKF